MRKRTRVDGKWAGHRRMGAVAVVGALFLAGSGCDDGTTGVELEPAGALLPAATEVTLPLGQAVLVDGGPLRLTFTRVVQDSRCPVDATCVWEGNAVVEVRVAADQGPGVLLQLNSTLEPRSLSWSGLRLTFVELLPRPRLQEPPDEAPVLRLLLERAEG